MKVNKAFLVAINVLFFLLLFWPLYGILSYMLFSENIRQVVAFGMIVLEIAVGLACLACNWISRKQIPKTAFFIIMPLNALLFIGYVFSVLYVYVLNPVK